MSERSVNEDNLQGSWVELHYSGPPAGQEAEKPEEVLSGSPPAGQEEPEEVLCGSAREEEAVPRATSEEEPGPGLVQAVVLGTEVPLREQEVAEIQARLQGGEKGSGSGQGEVQRPGLPQAGVQGGEKGPGSGQEAEQQAGSGQGGEQRPGPGQGGEQRAGSGQGGEQRAGLPQAAVQGVDLEKMLLDAQHESGRSSSRGSLPCDSPPRSQTPLHLRCGSDTHSSAEKNSSQSEEDYLDRRREVENLMKKNADWIWDWSSRPENLPPKELLLRLPKRSTPLSIRNTRVMKKGGIFSSDFLKLFLPSLLLSHVLAVGLGVYIGRRLIPPPSNF